MKRHFLIILSLVFFLATVAATGSPYYLYQSTTLYGTCGGDLTVGDGRYNGNVFFVPTTVQLTSAYATYALFYGGAGAVTMVAAVFDLGDASHAPRAPGQGWSDSASLSQIVATSPSSTVAVSGPYTYSRFDFPFPTHPTLLSNHWYFMGATVTADTAGVHALQTGGSTADLNLYYEALLDGPSSTIYMAGIPSCWDVANSPSGIEVTADDTPLSLLSALSPAKVWVGLKNSDDVGIRFDLQAKVYLNGSPIATGQLNSVSGGSSGFSATTLSSIPLTLTGPVTVSLGNILRIDVLVRNACSGSGKNSGTARLWYNGQPVDTGATRDAGSRFDATITDVNSNYFLGGGNTLSTAAGSSKLSVDKVVGAKCGAFSSFGSWSMTLP